MREKVKIENICIKCGVDLYHASSFICQEHPKNCKGIHISEKTLREWANKKQDESEHKLYPMTPEESHKEETLREKLESLVVQWHQRQEHYVDVAYKHVDDAHNNRKFTYKAMATRDCWKELLTLLNSHKDE